MAVLSDINLRVLAAVTLDAPYGGRGAAELQYRAAWSSGTTDNKADLAGQASTVVAGSGNVDLDLRAIVGPDGDALNGAELALLYIKVPDAASGNISVKVAAANGADIFDGTTDSAVLRPGGLFILGYPKDGGPALDASNRLINLANAGGSDTTVEVLVLQRSA